MELCKKTKYRMFLDCLCSGVFHKMTDGEGARRCMQKNTLYYWTFYQKKSQLRVLC